MREERREKREERRENGEGTWCDDSSRRGDLIQDLFDSCIILGSNRILERHA